MKYNNRKEYTQAAASEKNTLVFVYPAQRLLIWENNGTNKWLKTVDFLVEKVKKGDVYLTKAANAASINSTNQYFYDIKTNELHLYSTNTNPDFDNVIVFYKLCYSNAPLKISHNLVDDGEIVQFEPRVQSNPGFKSVLATDSVALVSGGTLSLENNDGYFNTIYKSLIWESKLVEIFSYNKFMPITETKIIYRGFIENKTFTSSDFNLSVKDIQRQLEEKIKLTAYDSEDNVDPKYFSTYKRMVYGKAMGMECRSVSQIKAEGYFSTHPMTVINVITTQRDIGDTTWITYPSDNVGNDDLNPWAVDYTLQQTLPKDVYCIKIGTNIFTYDERIVEDFQKFRIIRGFLDENNNPPPNGTHTYTYLKQDGTPITKNYCYAPGEVEIIPLVEVSPSLFNYQLNYNRKWQVAGHRLSAPTATIQVMTELNRFYVDNAQEFYVGDRIEVAGYAYTIAQVSENMIRTTSASLSGYNVGATVLRKAVQGIYINGARVPSSEIKSQSNELLDMSIEITKMAELMSKSLVFNTKSFLIRDVVYFNNSPYITLGFDKESGFDKVFKEGDVIATTGTDLKNHLLISKIENLKVNSGAGAPYEYDIIAVSIRFIDYGVQVATWVNDIKIAIASTPTAFSFTKTTEFQPLYNDDSLVVDCYGKTLDGTASGKMLSTGAEIIKDVIQYSSIMKDFLSDDAFAKASLENDYQMSVILPWSLEDKAKPSIKEVVNKINKTLKTSLYLDNDLNIAMKSLNAVRDPIQFIINDDDVISWNIQGKSNDLYADMETSYDFRDFYVSKQQKDNLIQNNKSQFVADFEISGKTLEQEMLLRDATQVQELSERILYGKTLTENVVKIKGAFSLVDLEVGQQVVVNIKKVYKNIYNQARVLGMITSITRTGESVEIEVSDLGNLFDRIAVVSDDSTIDYDTDDADLKMNSSYITDENGLIEGEDDTSNTNIIG